MYPTVSIICPIRNEERYIGQCLHSLINQTYENDKIEILVIDGMSEDKTREIVHNYQLKYKNIRLIDNPQKIVPSALNIGIKKAAGKYILRMDGHAKAAFDYVEMCIAALVSNGVECVGGPIINLNNTNTGRAIAMSSSFGVGNSTFRTSKNTACFVDTLAFPAFKREVFDKFGLFDEELIRGQDEEFNLRMRKFGGKILLTPEIKSWYFPRSSLKKLWKQYFGYGYWKIRILQKHFLMMQPRHFVPFIFVLSLLVTIGGGFVYSKIWLLSILIFTTYFFYVLVL